MRLISDIKQLKLVLNSFKNEGNSIGFVPTMGALHAGHLALVRKAKNENTLCVCSIFVNPTQFNNAEDLKKYPRTLESDLQLLETENCDIVFLPTVNDMYPQGYNPIGVNLNGLDTRMEGAHRPGHFSGVVTVVSLFFDYVEPHKAYFGEKDFQQLRIIQRMTTEQKREIEIVPCPIIREENGLAMSSRNKRLSENGKSIASNIYKSLCFASENANKYPLNGLIENVKSQLSVFPEFEIEYIEVLSESDLLPIDKRNPETKARMFVALYLEGVRLIDNMPLRLFESNQ
jgi:pantoate--beta-alanine ligase